MIVLGVDCVSSRSGAALLAGDRIVAVSNAGGGPSRPSEDLLRQILSVLEAAALAPVDVELVAVTRGPGSMTGLRAGYATLHGLFHGRVLPVAPVSTFEALSAACGGRPAIVRIRKTEWLMDGGERPRAFDASGLNERLAGVTEAGVIGELPPGCPARAVAPADGLAASAARIGQGMHAAGHSRPLPEILPDYGAETYAR